MAKQSGPSWFDYQAEKALPKPREKPVEPREIDPPSEPSIDITVEESPGQDGLDTIVEKVRKFWDR